MAQIEDFGQKIGGARKDAWKKNGITANDFAEMNDLERNTYVKKDNIWIKPDWEQLVAAGTPQTVAYWQNKMRVSLPSKPPSGGEDVQENYISIVSQVRDAVMAVQDKEGIEKFYKDFLIPNFSSLGSSYYFYAKPEAEGIITDKVKKASQLRYYKLEREAKHKLFGIPKTERDYVLAKQNLEIFCFDGKSSKLEMHPYKTGALSLCVKSGLSSAFYTIPQDSEFSDITKWKENTYFVLNSEGKPLRINFPTLEEAESFVDLFARGSQIVADINAESHGKEPGDFNRKKNFVPPQLAHVRYTGPKYRGVRSANSQMFLDDLKFRGGEFGNWLNNADRQTSLDMGYDALRNLADILKVPPEDISLNGKLAIAFGARGRGGPSAGAAHYEPLRQVINLTKMFGAGCLAHEWFHALDHAIGLASGEKGFASEAKRTCNLPDSFIKLLDSLKYKDGTISIEDQKKSIEPSLQDAQENLKGWIVNVKPDILPKDLSNAWDNIASRIMANTYTFSGGEYWSFSRRDPVITHPDVEQLSQICKFVNKKSIPRSSKYQICLWAQEVNRNKKRIQELEVKFDRVKTDFLKNSEEFDKIYSKYGHGYWSSDCEMLARAFDCYISDKIKEQEYCSDFLSSHSDSFSFRQGDKVIAAFPQGEERAVINQAFDALFEELKELQMLHDAPLVEQVIEQERGLTSRQHEDPVFTEPDPPTHYEQLSLDEILFAASARAGQATSGRHGNLSDRSR